MPGSDTSTGQRGSFYIGQIGRHVHGIAFVEHHIFSQHAVHRRAESRAIHRSRRAINIVTEECPTYAITHLETGNAIAKGDDFAGTVRQCNQVNRHWPAEVTPKRHQQVAEVEGGSTHLNQDFTGSRCWLWQLSLYQTIETGTAGFDNKRFHGYSSEFFASNHSMVTGRTFAGH